MSVIFDELKQIVASFNSHNIEFALCGGLAVSAHGLVRATQDIDFLIREGSLDAAYKAAASAGYDIRGLDISFKERAVQIRRVSKVVGEDVISLDLLLVTPDLEHVWAGREQIGFEGLSLFVVSRDGLIDMKRQAGRPQDLADIERLENEKG
jgi:hypothetical protein